VKGLAAQLLRKVMRARSPQSSCRSFCFRPGAVAGGMVHDGHVPLACVGVGDVLVHASSDLLHIGCLVAGDKNQFEVESVHGFHTVSLCEPCKVRL
jgi:hypothetical protein